MPQTSLDPFGHLWLDSAAGALILAPQSDLPSWPGVDTTPYDESCRNDSPWLFPVTSCATAGEFLSLWCERTSAAWVAGADQTEGVIWRWIMGPYKTWEITPPPLPAGLKQLQDPVTVKTKTTEWFLFDSIDTGTDALAVGLPIKLASPLRQVTTWEYRPKPSVWMVLHHLTT